MQEGNCCPDCGNSMYVRVHQAISNQQVVWSASYRCTDCGIQIEEDGWGSLPDQFRAKLLETGGTWNLIIEETSDRRIVAIKLLRNWMGWSLAEAAIAQKKIPGNVLSGTKVEMERLKMLLSSEGVKAAIAREA
jgi:hypothetical protein